MALDDFTPHGFCLAWRPQLIWLHALSDSLIALAYFSIPAALTVFVNRREDLAFRPVFSLFAGFILACGTSHILGVITLWFPLYELEGGVKALTAAVSLATAAVLWPLLPRALALPSPAHLRALNRRLEDEILERDRTAAKLSESEARLHQSQKMEAVGQLTGGIAHDFNNLLTSMLGALELLEKRGTLDERSGRLVATARESALRGARLTSQLLAFSRRQRLAPEALDTADVLAGLGELLGRTVGERIAVILMPPPAGLWPILADRTQLEMAVLNLVLNARDAIDGDGKIIISVRNQVITQEQTAQSATAMGDFVSILVEDTGRGMAPEVKARALEPFFTTKPPGVGTGLGLSQTYGFAAQSGGAVHIESELGKGTRVELVLPRAPEQRHMETANTRADGDATSWAFPSSAQGTA